MKRNMSLAIDLETQDRLKNLAKKKDVSVSRFIRDLIDKNYPMEDVSVVVLKIPKNLPADELRNWLAVRVDVLVKQLSAKDDTQK